MAFDILHTFLAWTESLGGGWGRREGRRRLQRPLAAEKGGQRPAPPCPHLCVLKARTEE